MLIDADALREIIVPCCVINRRLSNGKRDPNEIINQSQVFITTAGYKDSYAYKKLIELLAESVINPDEVMILGGTWHIPVNEGLQPRNFISSLKLEGTFNETSFDREWNSKWTGDYDQAFFSSEKFDKCRNIQKPELAYSNKSGRGTYYVLGVDIGRLHDTTEVSVIKVNPQPQGDSLKRVVAFYSKEGAVTREQAIFIKQLYYKYKARAIAIDGMGIGVGVVDELVLAQDDPVTEEHYPPFEVFGGSGDNLEQPYRKYRTQDMEKNAVYIIKANPVFNNDAYQYLKAQIEARKISFLIGEREARADLMETKAYLSMDAAERKDKLIQYQLTDNLKTQLGNLVRDGEGEKVKLKRNSRAIPKDRVSSLIYGLYYIKKEEEKRKKRGKSSSITDYLFFS